jgi:choline transporter-like protein 2/4/5
MATVADEKLEERKREMKEDGIMGSRPCTDWVLIIIATLFVIGWIIILSVAVSRGQPERMLMPSNFRGDLCGDKAPLTDYPNQWIPRASRLSYGLCVETCPTVGDYICNNDEEMRYGSDDETDLVPNHYYNHKSAAYFEGQRILFKCQTSSCTDEEEEIANRFIGLNVKIKQYKCFVNWYASGATLYRCLPFQDERDNATLADLAGDSADALSTLADYVGAGSFFNRGFGEVEQSWLVILLCCISCCVLSFTWLVLLRWIMKPLVYLCILLIFALLVAIGYLAMLMADDLENSRLPGDTATEDQVKLWRALEFGAWFLAAIYLVVMAWLFKRVKIAIAIMRQASYTFTESPGLVVVPIFVFLAFVGWVAFFIVTTVYIQTMGDLEDGVFTAAARDTFGDAAVNFTLDAYNSTADYLTENNITNNTAINTSEWSQDDKIKALHAYNFFGFLWASTFCIMFGFFVTAMTGTVYYFSATQEEMRLAEAGMTEAVEGAEVIGKEKETPYFTIPKAALIGLTKQLGTILFGALLIAIIQFIRALFLYFKEQFLEEWSETATIGCLIKCIEYCLWYIQKVVEVISKNAFIVNCVLRKSFCGSAGTAMEMIGANAARVGILETLAVVACFVLKVVIVLCNMIVAWVLINIEALTQDEVVESGLFPMFGILIISFIIASIFVNVYESLVDTTLMCFLLDEEYFQGEYMVEELAELTDLFKGAEEARLDYERKLREASNKKPGSSAEPKSEPAN